MNSAERVERVMNAIVRREYEGFPDDYEHFGPATSPLIPVGEEIYWGEEPWRILVRRILAAADGVEEFTDIIKPYRAPKPVYRSKKPNLEGRKAYEDQKKERRQA